jgi:DNA helicase II / ATP-dependent DNA helicase PcrA
VFGSEWADGLDDAQRAAVIHGAEPLIVLAGAGTGKTRVLTSRVASLIERGAPAERILLLTFTRRAAADMTARAAQLGPDRAAASRVWGGTFHAVAHRLVAEHAEQLGLAAVSVLDAGDVVDLLDLIRDEHGLTGTETRLPSGQTLADVYTRAVNNNRPVRAVLATDFPAWAWCADQIVSVLGAFVARKRARGLLDFDDLLLAWRQLLADPVIGARLRARWDHVLVDEYQDVNQIQVDIVTGLRPDGAGLTVVGDDAQAVYGFRGARSGHLLELAATLPGATVVRLERNFRSVQPLLDLANVVRPGDGAQRITLHADRTGPRTRPRLVPCYDAEAQARAVVDAVLHAHEDGQALREQAVLMRAAGHSRELEVELSYRRVPYVKYGGLRFIDTAHVKDFLAVLRLLTNTGDEVAWFRLLQLHTSLGKARARALVALLVDDGAVANAADNADTAEDAADRAGTIAAAAPARARTVLTATLTGVTRARAHNEVVDQVQACLELLRPLVRAHYLDGALRVDDLDRLAAAAATCPDLPGFVAELTLDPAAASTDYAKPPRLDDDYLTLSTVHSAKGLEWPRVHLIHAIDGAFPSDMALSDPDGLDEEHRLFYVAVTRARDELAIYTPTRMHTTGYHDRHVYAQPSRFLDAGALSTLDRDHIVHGQPAPRAPGDLPAVVLPSLQELFD